ncbi:MAG: sulfatase-like hydrolase/transferase [Verrucomicrobiota bacterium]
MRIPLTNSALASFLLLLAAPLIGSEKPNVIVIMSDDQGKWALGAYDERIETPNIDYLASRGVRFDQAISPVPVCSAARASFMTGKMPSQHGVHDFLSEDFANEQGWLAEETLLSEELQALGYRVGLFGKWHADNRGWKPARGFDRWLSYDEREAPWINQYLHSGTVHFSRDGVAEKYTGVQAHFLTTEAVRFIDQPDERPFAIFLNYVEPHFPFEDLPERLVARYRPIANEIVASGGSSSLIRPAMHGETIPDHVERLSQYLAAVTLLDEQVGRVLDALQGRNLLAETVVIYTSDQGHLTGQYGLYGKGNASLPQNLYEASINIPLIVSGPHTLIQAGQMRSDFVTLIDLNRTLVDLAGGTPDSTTGPGISLRPLLRGERIADWRSFHFAEYGNARMVHDGRWKLVAYFVDNASSPPVEQWFDLAHPLGEMRPSPPPSDAQQAALRTALTDFFAAYTSPNKSGTRIWSLPKQNGMEPWRQ